MEGVEVADVSAPGEFGDGERGEDVEMSAMGGGAVDAVDERHLAENVLAGVDLVGAAVDDGDGEQAVVGEQHHDGNLEEPIDLAGDLRELGARIGGALEGDVEEQV